MSRTFAGLLLFLVAGLAHALDGESILKQVDRKLNPESYEMYRKLVNIIAESEPGECVVLYAAQLLELRGV